MRVRGALPAVLLTLFLMAGALKGSPLIPHLPVDLTFLLAACVALRVVHELLAGGRKPVVPLLVLGAVFVVGALHQPLTDYGQQKTVYLFTLTFGCAAVGGAILLSTRERRAALLPVTVGAGLTMVALQILAPAQDAALAGRLAAEGSTTIAAARFTGAGLVALAVLVMLSKVRLLVAVLLAAPMLWLAVGTGSRGPLLAAVIAVALTALLRVRLQPSRVVTVLVVAVGGSWWAWHAASDASRARILMALSPGDQGQSVELRREMWARTRVVIDQHPWGIGWGNLVQPLYPIDRYPHNMILEVFGEAGWLAGAAFVAVLALALVRVRGAFTREPAAVGLFALLVFWLVSAMVSGDLNDNRGVFVLLGACLTLTVVTARRGQAERPVLMSIVRM